MNIVINQQTLNEIEAQISDYEGQKERIDEYLGGLRAYHAGAKAYLEAAVKFKNVNGSGVEIGDGMSPLMPNNSNKFSISAGNNSENQSCESLPETFDNKNQSHCSGVITATADNKSDSAQDGDKPEKRLLEKSEANEAPSEKTPPQISDDDFRRLSQYQAIRFIFRQFAEKIPITQLKHALTKRGWQSKSKHFEQNLVSMLRYYGSKGIFERDEQNRWGLSSEEISKDEDFSGIGKPSDSDCSFEVLKDSGLEWLHIAQLVILIERRYGYAPDKDALSSTLRKAATRGKRFRFFGENRFGLLDYAPAAKNVSA